VIVLSKCWVVGKLTVAQPPKLRLRPEAALRSRCGMCQGTEHIDIEGRSSRAAVTALLMQLMWLIKASHADMRFDGTGKSPRLGQTSVALT
jgi:hypothetical protein